MRGIRAFALPIAVAGLYFAPLPVESCDPNARVFFIRPFNGATVTSPVQVIFGAEIVDVRPAPEGEPGGNVGHHDLLINLGSVPSISRRYPRRVPRVRRNHRFSCRSLDLIRKGRTEVKPNIVEAT
jgi:hypothetical protein